MAVQRVPCVADVPGGGGWSLICDLWEKGQVPAMRGLGVLHGKGEQRAELGETGHGSCDTRGDYHYDM